ATYSGAFQVDDAHLGPLQLVLVGTALEGSALMFQVPTGALADVFSRRLSVVIGHALTGAGFVLWGASTQFELILLAQVVWGLGYTFVSGAEEAWIAGEIGEARAADAFLRGSQARLIGGIGGILLSAPLVHFGLAAPILAGGVLTLALAAFLALTMPEDGFSRRSGRIDGASTVDQVTTTLRRSVRAVRRSAIIPTILFIAAIFGAASEGYDRLGVAHFLLDTGLPPLFGFDRRIWFSVLTLGAMLLGLAAAEIVRRRLDSGSHRAVAGLLATFNLGLCLAFVTFALSGSFALAAGMFWTIALLRRTSDPLKTIWLNQNLEPSIRATVFSMAGQADAFGQVLGGPIIGIIAAAVSVRAGITVAGLFLAPAMLLYARTLRRPLEVPSPAQ
ncbi:MAG TPA: MFS transporter, partial [Dehalococcoidia bacterium]|nr:MFS transporter [Dehalococcoidia bacterium]